MPVVGTAGHVDHGKSTLVRALTGRDPDRWQEEKDRGLTIDLGFGWTTLDDGTEIGFVDVPGHERFIKNMLAGVDAIDVALFVVAADEGWMPQSEEHLAVLDLLGISSAIIVLTRADLVDEETLELAELEVRDRLEGTALDGSPVLAAAAPEGTGVTTIRAALQEALAAVPPRTGERPRLWIDRAFTIGGAGTVVTGTLVGGSIAVGDELFVYPAAGPVRVRSIQSHERSLDSIGPGNRTALNLVGVDREEIGRGAMLGAAGAWRTTTRFLADLRTVRSLGGDLQDRGAYHLHAGSGAWPARLRLLAGSAADSGQTAAVLHADGPIPLQVGDRFVLREVGRRAVVAGGRVLDPDPPRRGAALLAAVPTLRAASPEPDHRARALLEVRGRADLDALAAETGGGKPGEVLIAGRQAMSPGALETALRTARAAVDEFHAANPLRPGIPKASLAERLGIGPTLLEALLDTAEDLCDAGAVVHSAGFEARLSADAEAAWVEARARLRESGFAVPRVAELDLDVELLRALVRRGDLIEVSGELAYLPESMEDLVERVRTISGPFTVAEFRDLLGITRKYAVPLLEWLDREGITRRRGDEREVRP